MFIGGTSLLTETYREGENARAQAFNDFTIFSAAAISSLAAGSLLHLPGWQLVNYAVLPLILVAVLAHVWLWTSRRNQLMAADA